MPCIFCDPVNPVVTYLLDQSQLPKFVQINWCGDGVPEAKKGLFHTHSGAVARFLRGTHVVVSARNEVCDFVNVSTPNSSVLE
jgi:Cofilin/tropomyosin-type actin-binding protein